MIGMICANLILASRQGFGERKTEQLGGHSQEQQRHRQAPIDDDDGGLDKSLDDGSTDRC